MTRSGSRGRDRRRCRGWSPTSAIISLHWPSAGTDAVVVCPIGFVADHIEVVWDLDHELRLQAQESHIAFARATTPNADLARVVADLLDELRTDRDPVRVPGPDAPPLQGFSVDGVVCTPRCDTR